MPVPALSGRILLKQPSCRTGCLGQEIDKRVRHEECGRYFVIVLVRHRPAAWESPLGQRH